MTTPRPELAALAGLTDEERASSVASYFEALELEPNVLDPERTTAEAFLAAIAEAPTS